MQTNSKPAVEKSDWSGEFGGCMAAFLDKSGRKLAEKIIC
jgi:hypothetical protein